MVLVAAVLVQVKPHNLRKKQKNQNKKKRTIAHKYNRANIIQIS